MPKKITEYTAVSSLNGPDVTDWSVEVDPGVFATRKITYTDLLADLYVDLEVGDLFKQGGNSFGDTATLGTIDNEELSFITNGTEKMKITTDGTVIINNINNAIGLIAFADGFVAGAFSQNDTATAASALSVESFSENGLAAAGVFVMRNTVEDDVSIALNLTHLLTTPDAGEDGIGIGVRFSADDDAEFTQIMGDLYYKWIDSTHATRTSAFVVKNVFQGVDEELFGIYARNMVFNADFGAMDGEGVIMIGDAQDPPSGISPGHFYLWSEDIAAVDSVPHFMNGEGHLIKLYTPNAATPYAITNAAGALRVIDTATITLPNLARIVATMLGEDILIGTRA